MVLRIPYNHPKIKFAGNYELADCINKRIALVGSYELTNKFLKFDYTAKKLLINLNLKYLQIMEIY
jgi:hypothetical protein